MRLGGTNICLVILVLLVYTAFVLCFLFVDAKVCNGVKK